MLFIPEIELYNQINFILNYIKHDYSTKEVEDTFLHQILNGNAIEGYDYFLQATDLFNRANTHSRKIHTTISFNAQKAHLPTIHITLPSEQTEGNGIGLDAGIYDPIQSHRGSQEVLRRAFTSRYDLLITSDNNSEVLLIYHVLRAAIISFIPVLEHKGFKNIKLSGQDIRISNELIPNMFMKGIGISFNYEVLVPDLVVNKDVLTFFNKPTIMLDNG